MMMLIIFLALFYMHRGFFALALEDSPNDPMGSKYSHSVLASYNSAMSFVNLAESLFNQHPKLTERMWFLFTHVFSCSVGTILVDRDRLDGRLTCQIVLGELALKPKMVIARSALSQLESAYNLFSRVSNTTRTGKILVSS